jgi:endonuclease/exonuclease/phosphatase family metal-dependent hydrolase
VAWNAQRGGSPEAAATLLRATGAGIFLLSELDLGMARSQQRHTARELASRLGCGYAFGVEFLELGLGDAQEREAHAGRENAVGYHGGAILSAHALVEPTLVRIERSGRWFDGALGERRVGSRVAVLCRLPVGGREVAFASVHLESHSDPDERAAQLEAVFDALDAFAPGAPALVGGDVNTHSLGRAELADRALLSRALEVDPRRLAEPVRHEPLFARAERRGYEWRPCNAVGTSTERRRRGDGSARGTLALDWFFARGLDCSAPAVIDAVDPATGAPLSDHEAIAVTIRCR